MGQQRRIAMHPLLLQACAAAAHPLLLQACAAATGALPPPHLPSPPPAPQSTLKGRRRPRCGARRCRGGRRLPCRRTAARAGLGGGRGERGDEQGGTRGDGQERDVRRVGCSSWLHRAAIATAAAHCCCAQPPPLLRIAAVPPPPQLQVLLLVTCGLPFVISQPGQRHGCVAANPGRRAAGQARK